MKLSIDKRFIKAGDIIEVSWDCEEALSPRLVLNTSNHENVLSVPNSGTKRFRMKGRKGKHSIGLIAQKKGKDCKITKRIFVYGKMSETDEFEYVDRGDASPMNRWNNSIKNWWDSYSPEKKKLYILLLLLLLFHFLYSIPAISAYSNILFYGIICWLFWQVIKRD